MSLGYYSEYLMFNMEEVSLWEVINYQVGFIPSDASHLKITCIVTAGPFLLNTQGEGIFLKMEIRSILKQVSETGEGNLSTLFLGVVYLYEPVNSCNGIS